VKGFLLNIEFLFRDCWSVQCPVATGATALSCPRRSSCILTWITVSTRKGSRLRKRKRSRSWTKTKPWHKLLCHSQEFSGFVREGNMGGLISKKASPG